jgi:hypothetical protein
VSILFLCSKTAIPNATKLMRSNNRFTNMEHRFKNTQRFLSHPKHKLAIIKTLTLRNLTKTPIKKKKKKKEEEIIIKLIKLYIYIYNINEY